MKYLAGLFGMICITLSGKYFREDDKCYGILFAVGGAISFIAFLYFWLGD